MPQRLFDDELKTFVIPTSELSTQAEDKMIKVNFGDWADVLFEKLCQKEGFLLLHKKRQPSISAKTPIIVQQHEQLHTTSQQLSQDVQQHDTICPICDELIVLSCE